MLKETPYYFEFKMQIFPHFYKLKIRVRIKFEILA